MTSFAWKICPLCGQDMAVPCGSVAQTMFDTAWIAQFKAAVCSECLADEGEQMRVAAFTTYQAIMAGVPLEQMGTTFDGQGIARFVGV